MMIDQGDILYGTTMVFVKEYMDISENHSYEKGEFLFHEGDPAAYFYTLLKGVVRLKIFETGHKIYMVNKPGEAFGWSSIVGRTNYSASAECTEPTTLLKIDRDKLGKLLEKHPDCGCIFYKKLAEILGNRLIQCYELISSSS